ncbi:retrovirus-related pol polyprotein from transposon TNT 1-94 [Tanacetum coccineum]
METIHVTTRTKHYSSTTCNPPNRDDWDTLFQPLFDEYFNPTTIVVSPVPIAAAPRAEFLHEDSTSQGSSSNVRPSHTPFELIGRWTKDHPIANVISDPSRSVSTRKQLKTDAIWCYFDAFLTFIELNNLKQAMIETSWIDAMQEELYEFEILQEYPSHVYKLKKALYGLKQAPRTWYDMLSNFLISQHFSKGVVDPTLFTQKARNDLLLVQIYVDDIIFSSTNTALCNEFANQMTTKFKMSMMGQMSFFLGLQISQSPRDTPMMEKNKLDKDLEGTPVDATLYRGMNGIVKLYIVQVEYQPADIFTKPLPRERFNFLIEKLGNKKCIVNAEVFRTILNICPRVEGVDFTEVPDDDTALTFLIDLGYKGPLYKHTNIKSRIDILWGMFKRVNVDYPKLIWEDLPYQIDYIKEKRSRRENMPFTRFTKIIINHFLKQHKSLINLNYQHYHTIKDDGIQSKYEAYQMFIKYSTGQIRPKKSRGKGSQGKKTVDDSQETVDVSEESKPEPAKKKTSSKRRVKKKVTLSADDNIISYAPDAALELAKIVTESVPESAKKKYGGISSKSVVIQDTLSAPNSKPATSKTKLKGAPSLTLAEQEAADIIKALKESKKDDKDGDVDNEGDNHISDTQDADDEDVKIESDEEDIYKYKIRVRKDEDEEMINAEVDDFDKGDEEIIDAAKADAEKTLEAKDDAKKTKLPTSSSSLSVSLGFGDQFLKLSSDSYLVITVKDTTDSEINSLLEVKIHSEVPHTQSPSVLSVPISVNSEPTVPTPVQESPSTASTKTLPPPFVSTIPSIPQHITTLILTPTITTDALTVTTAVPESNALIVVELRVAKLEIDMSELKTIDHSTEALVILKSQVPSVVDNYLGSKVWDVFQKELNKHTAYLIQKYYMHQFSESSKKQTPTVNLKQGSAKSALEILQIKREQAEKQQKLKYTIKPTDKSALEEYDLKRALYQFMHANKLFNRNPANHRLYHALMESLIEDENAMDKGVANTLKDHKRNHDDDEDDDDED